MKHLNRITAKAAVLAMALLIIHGTALAQVGQDPKTNARPDRIVGLWDVTATVTNCANGAPLTSFAALHKYELGGTGQVVPATSPTALSAHMMIWNHLGGNDYGFSMKMFQFNPAGVPVGWLVVTSKVSIDEDANAYSGSGVAQFFDTAGNLLGGSCPVFTGTRFTG